ncbi:intraflagellar transport-associated protein-like isoform X2 [Oculina patagonica]
MAKGEGVVKSDEHSVDLDQYAKDALDEVFSKEEQTYEEFLQGFMFLKKDDVTGMKAHSSKSNSQNGTCCDKKASSNTVSQGLLSQNSQLSENDNIPEEVLGPGSTAVPILMRTADSSSGTVLQVDNFVDCEDELSDDDDVGKNGDKLNSFLKDNVLSSNYSPSVLSHSNSSNSKEDEPSLQDPHPKVDLDDESHKTAKEICFLSDASTLPGEVDDNQTPEQQDASCEAVITPNIRQLEISTRINNRDEKDDLIRGDVGSDEVQPFTLDTDFDYDNVALTPKFSFVPKPSS